MKKRISALLLLLSMSVPIVSLAAPVEGLVKIKVNDKFVNADLAYIGEDSRTMIPVTFVAKELGYTVAWDKATSVAKFEKDTEVFEIGIEKAGRKSYLKKGESVITLDTPAIIKSGRTMVPLSYVGQAIGGEVIWNADSQTVQIQLVKEFVDASLPKYEKPIVKFKTSAEMFKNSKVTGILKSYVEDEKNITIDFIKDAKVIKTVKDITNADFLEVDADYVAIYTNESDVYVGGLE